MPSKCPLNWEARRVFLLERINDYFRQKKSNIVLTLEDVEKGLFKHESLFTSAKHYVCQNYLFCDYRSIDRFLKPYTPKVVQKSIFDNNQQFTLNL